MENLKNKALQAGIMYLRRKDYRVLHDDKETNRIVCVDDGMYVLVDVHVALDRIPTETAERSERELYLAQYLANNVPDGDVMLRFDDLSMHVFDSGHAMLRHHINAIGEM